MMRFIVPVAALWLSALYVGAQEPAPQAVLGAQRAALAAPRDPIAIAWLQQIAAETSVFAAPYSASDLAAALLSFQEHSLIVFGLWCFLNVLYLLSFVSARGRTLLQPLRLLTLLALLGVGGWFAVRLIVDTTQPRAVVTSAVPLRVGADESFLVVDALPAAELVRVLQTSDKWLLVTTLNGRVGWVPTDGVEYVIPPD